MRAISYLFQIYLDLFRMYLGVEEETGGKALENPNILAALQVLTKHHQHIDTARVKNAHNNNKDVFLWKKFCLL
eukprot:m.189377 g.189377  ORF g.189377 m.189377 type:complete len:74 (+) comp39409_c0_seq1:2360-2581(+)